MQEDLWQMLRLVWLIWTGTSYLHFPRIVKLLIRDILSTSLLQTHGWRERKVKPRWIGKEGSHPSIFPIPRAPAPVSPGYFLPVHYPRSWNRLIVNACFCCFLFPPNMGPIHPTIWKLNVNPPPPPPPLQSPPAIFYLSTNRDPGTG